MKSSATNHKIAWFRRESEQDTLDLSPSFQRRPVWNDEQASYLIDTILYGLPIPEIYVRSSSTPKGEARYEVVDGQQRMRAILKFASNDLALEGDEIGEQWLGKQFEDLSDKEKMAFWDYEIVTRDVSGASDLEIRNLFKRLNIHSVTLNDQELRHSELSGHFIKTMESLADSQWWLENKIVNIRQIRRMEDVEYISELFVGLIAGPQDKKTTLDEYYENYDSSMPDKSKWVSHFEDTLELIQRTLSPEQIRQWSGKSDFYTLFLAMGGLVERGELNSKQRKAVADALARLRTSIDAGKRKDSGPVSPMDVARYVEAVTRAATDRGRREIRLRVLEKRLQTALEKVK